METPQPHAAYKALATALRFPRFVRSLSEGYRLPPDDIPRMTSHGFVGNASRNPHSRRSLLRISILLLRNHGGSDRRNFSGFMPLLDRRKAAHAAPAKEYGAGGIEQAKRALSSSAVQVGARQ